MQSMWKTATEVHIRWKWSWIPVSRVIWYKDLAVNINQDVVEFVEVHVVYQGVVELLDMGSDPGSSVVR